MTKNKKEKRDETIKQANERWLKKKPIEKTFIEELKEMRQENLFDWCGKKYKESEIKNDIQ